ncbi:MAG: tetratricopeptide repeat protein [Planctomycetes bacterium]|nr:tetratricopeptide repeat protein [Planctomycetota bacterium]
MADNSSNDTPRSDATMPLPAEIARIGGGERFGRFHLSKRLGAGISHDLWQAWDPEKQQWLALRVWPRPPAGEKERVHAAGKAARAAADPRIVAPVGGGLEAGQLWVARPYLEALPVRDLPWQDGRTLGTVARACAEALAGAHAKGLAHGRVTAGNVLVVSKETKGRGWAHAISLTEFGLSEGDAASDAKSLGRLFCELTGQPTPGSGATTKAAPEAGGDSTDVAKKGDTTRGSSSGDAMVYDGALVGIFLRARDGQLTATAMAAELGAWLSRRPAAPRTSRTPLFAAAVAAAALLAIGIFAVLHRGHGGAEAARALEESARAEADGRLAAALERARFAATADPANPKAAEAVKRLAAALKELESALEATRATEAGAKEADRRVREARTALAAAEEEARSAAPQRETVDRLLGPALSAIEAALRAKPGHAPALRLLEEAATLFEPGDLSRLPRGADGRPVITPVIALRADLSAWAFSCFSPHGVSIARGDRSSVSLHFGIFPVGGKPVPFEPVPFPDPALPGRVALSLAEAGTAASVSPAAAAWSSAARALLSLDPEAALKAARAVQPAADDPFAADLAWIIAAADPLQRVEYFDRALRARPWDSLFLLSEWLTLGTGPGRTEALAAVIRAPGLYPGSPDLLVARAWSHYKVRDFDKSVADARSAAEHDPAAILLLANVDFTMDHYQECVAGCTEALRRDASLASALVIRAEAHHRLRADKAALADADEALRLDPDRFRAILLRAELRDFGGDRAGALSDCDKAIKLDAKVPDTWYIRGWVFYHAKDETRALEDAEKCISIDAGEPRGFVLRAFVKLRRNDFDGAIEDAEKALSFGFVEPLAWVARGVARWQKGNAEAGREDCTRALRASPGLVEGLRLRAFLRLELERNPDGVIEDATEVLAHDPQDLAMLKTRALAREDRGLFSGAIADCDAALAINPRFVSVLLIRASARGRLDSSNPNAETSRVLDDIERALTIEPKNVDALELKSQQLSRLGRNREAAEAMTRALDVKPGDLTFLSNRAAYRELAGDVEGALADAEALIKAAPASAAGFHRRCSLLLKKGDFEAALLDAVDGTRAEPANVGIWRLLGDVYRAKGAKDRALEAYGQAVKRAAPGDAEGALAESAIRKLTGK